MATSNPWDFYLTNMQNIIAQHIVNMQLGYIFHDQSSSSMELQLSVTDQSDYTPLLCNIC